MSFDPTFISSFTQLSIALAAAFVFALWLSLIIWTYRDITSRSRDLFVRLFATLVVAILYLPGILIYLILRPNRTLEEEYQQSLEEEALLQAIEGNVVCPGCSRRIQNEWIACPNCHTRLKKICSNCKRLMELPWNLCPYCGTATTGLRKENISIEETFNNLSETQVGDS